MESIIAQTGQARPTQFTAKDADRTGTNFAAGLVAAKQIVDASSNATNIVVFLSDGKSNGGGSGFDADLMALADTGAMAYTFGASSSCMGGAIGTLAYIAFVTEGTCTEVTDPSELAEITSGRSLRPLTPSRCRSTAALLRRSRMLTFSLPLPQDGPVSVDYSTTATGLGVGSHTMCVTALGADADAPGTSGEACTTIYVFAITLTQPTATKELGVDTTHTLTATIVGEAGTVDGRTVTFTITKGPNAGASDSCTVNVDCTTDASSNVSWTYTNTGGGGTDTIQACFTVATPTGQTGCDTATVRWADTTPPLAAWLPGPNPHGKQIPPAGNSSLPESKGGPERGRFL